MIQFFLIDLVIAIPLGLIWAMCSERRRREDLCNAIRARAGGPMKYYRRPFRSRLTRGRITYGPKTEYEGYTYQCAYLTTWIPWWAWPLYPLAWAADVLTCRSDRLPEIPT